MTESKRLILGGGVTGLAAGCTSGLPVFEAAEVPGGICSSYYVRPGTTERLHVAPADGEAYHFELGGGHWIFGGDPAILQFIRSLVGTSTYFRKSSVYFPRTRQYVPYPLQNNLRSLGAEVASRALVEMSRANPVVGPGTTMKTWLRDSFGPTLGELFFFPFHDLYTSGLFERIAPQDAYKSPVDLGLAIEGAFGTAPPVGYNVSFIYPTEGLNTLAQRMAAQCRIHYGKRAVKIDARDRRIYFADDSSQRYETLIATLSLRQLLELTGLSPEPEADPYTSVLVLNVGAMRGPACPDDHWLYHPATRAGFHRVGFYSNVDRHFLPRSARERGDRVSIYVERSYPGGARPSPETMSEYGRQVVAELQEWGYIGTAEVVDPTWVDVAYTWSWPGSKWKAAALKLLQEHQIYPVGRYGRWIFQGIADSIRDGFFVGGCFR